MLEKFEQRTEEIVIIVAGNKGSGISMAAAHMVNRIQQEFGQKVVIVNDTPITWQALPEFDLSEMVAEFQSQPIKKHNDRKYPHRENGRRGKWNFPQ